MVAAATRILPPTSMPTDSTLRRSLLSKYNIWKLFKPQTQPTSVSSTHHSESTPEGLRHVTESSPLHHPPPSMSGAWPPVAEVPPLPLHFIQPIPTHLTTSKSASVAPSTCSPAGKGIEGSTAQDVSLVCKNHHDESLRSTVRLLCF
jgi:hypothetical protein